MRTQITQRQIDSALIILKKKVKSRLDEKGYGTFASRHEILGILQEEYKELVDAIHSDKTYGHEVASELLDIAVGAIFGYACIQGLTVDW